MEITEAKKENGQLLFKEKCVTLTLKNVFNMDVVTFD